MGDRGYEEKLLLLTKAMDKELQEAQLRALKAEVELGRLREENERLTFRAKNCEESTQARVVERLDARLHRIEEAARAVGESWSRLTTEPHRRPWGQRDHALDDEFVAVESERLSGLLDDLRAALDA